MGKLTYLIIHCTATPAGRKVTSDDIRKWHIQGRGWSQVGYADMIHEDGTVENLVKYNDDDVVEPWEITNGAFGMNSVSRHVVYVGGLDAEGKDPEDTRTDLQKEAMEKYIRQMIEKHPVILIAGHGQFAAKACPSFDVPKWLEHIGIDPENIYLSPEQKKAKEEKEDEAKAKAEKAEADAKAKADKEASDKAKAEADAKAKANEAKAKEKPEVKNAAPADSTNVAKPKPAKNGKAV